MIVFGNQLLNKNLLKLLESTQRFYSIVWRNMQQQILCQVIDYRVFEQERHIRRKVEVWAFNTNRVCGIRR